MRDVPVAMQNIWRSGDYSGVNRPMARATIFRGFTKLFQKGFNTYASSVFGSGSRPMEIPNIKSLKWSRSIDQDTATMTLELFNTAPLPLGTVPDDPTRLDQPGYYTPTRGISTFSSRWNQKRNAWANMLLPDNFIRTFEGYGFDATKIPENDPNLVSTGFWRIDDVDFNSSGLIIIQARDLSSIMQDEVVLPPVVPRNFYPLTFSADQTPNPESLAFPTSTPSSSFSGMKPVVTPTVTHPIKNKAIPLAVKRLPMSFSDTSNTYYVGRLGNVYGHVPGDAFDGNQHTYWLSIGNPRNDEGYSYEWIEGAVGNVELVQVKFSTYLKNYFCYLSVYANGKWVAHHAKDVIPYDPTNPLSHNASNIPYCETAALGNSEGPHSITLRKPLTGVTKVRLTFHNLQAFTLGGSKKFRAAVREMSAYGLPLAHKPPATTGKTGTGAGAAGSSGTPDANGNIEAGGAVAIPKGAGQHPGYYRDYCADAETECLTARGWLRWDEIQVGDLALSMNPDSRLMEWTPVRDVYRKHRQRKMISMEGQLHSSLTTPDHKWLAVRQNGSTTWVTTETFKTGQRIPLAGPVAAPEAAKYDDAFVELVAWFWTEGWTGGVNDSAGLAQSEIINPVHTARIRECLTRLYGPAGVMLRGRQGEREHLALWNETRREDGVVKFRLARPVKVSLLEVMDADKAVVPSFLCALTTSQRTMFVERSLDADGWRTTQDRVGLAQRSEARAKAFEMACVLDGRAVRTRQDYNGMWSVNLLRSAFTLPQTMTVQEVDYDGVVWCPTLEHHNWVARRNGTVYLTGNTDIVKLFCAWGGFFWPGLPFDPLASFVKSDGTLDTKSFLAVSDPVLGNRGGRVWGDFEQTGTYGSVKIPVPQWDKKPLIDCFIGGTLVKTGDGTYAAIETVEIGDLVANATGYGVVVGRKAVKKSRLVRVTTANDSMVCTPSHRFLTRRGWVSAEELTASDEICTHQGASATRVRVVREAIRGNEDSAGTAQDVLARLQETTGGSVKDAVGSCSVRDVRISVRSATSSDEYGEVLLSSLLLSGEGDVERAAVRDLFEAFQAQGGAAAGVLHSVSAEQGVQSGARWPFQAAVSAVESTGTTVATGVVDQSVRCVTGSCLHDSRSSLTFSQNRRGAGWLQSCDDEAPEGRSPAGRVAHFVRVEGVEVLERGSARWSECCGSEDSVYVYDLTVSGNPSFVVGKEELVAHNCINYVRDIIGFHFFVDEDGGIVWRSPNWYRIGNYIGTASSDKVRTQEVVTIDELVNLTNLNVKISGRNGRERIFIAATDGKTGAVVPGYVPNPTGLRRVSGWTDQHFASKEECSRMADLIAIRQLMDYRQDTVSIPGFPKIQIDDQVRIFEEVTGEGYLHYVRTISSSNDLESGQYTFTLTTNWLGIRPDLLWAFSPDTLTDETKTYLSVMGLIEPIYGFNG